MIKPGHVVAIFGGAVAGSEAAARFAGRDIKVVVFDQNNLPYGKIENGLPKWHIKLRDSQESKIDQKLKHPIVQYVPGVIVRCQLTALMPISIKGFIIRIHLSPGLIIIIYQEMLIITMKFRMIRL